MENTKLTSQTSREEDEAIVEVTKGYAILWHGCSWWSDTAIFSGY